MKRQAARVALMLVATGCTTVNGWVVNPDVIGPHGEHLTELQCTTSEGCMALARETCAGDFDIITSNLGSQDMLVQCKTPPPADAGFFW